MSKEGQRAVRVGLRMIASLRARHHRRECLLCLLLVVPSAFSSLLAVPYQIARSAQDHAQAGLSFLRHNDLKTAETELRSAVALSPDNAEYLGDLGVILGMERNLKESTVYLQRALKLNPDNLILSRNLASNQWQMGQAEEAKRTLDHILETDPHDDRTILLLGMVEETLKDYAKAAQFLESVPELVQQQPASIVALARCFYNTGQKQRARSTLEALLHHPAGPGGVFMGGEVAADAHDDEFSEKLFISIRSVYPDPPVLADRLASVQYRDGQFVDCQETLIDVIVKGYEAPAVFNHLASCLAKSQDPLGYTARVVSQLPPAASNYLGLGRALEQHSELPIAIVVATRAVQNFPSSAEAYELKGTIELEMHSCLDAVQSFSRARDLGASSAAVQLKLAQAYWGAGMNSQAVATFEDGVKRFPHDPRLSLEYARMLLADAETGNPTADARALDLLRKAVALDPAQPDAHYQLGKFLLEKGKSEEALKELQTAAKLDESNSGVHFSLARAYRQLGRKADADKELQYFQKLKNGA